MKDVMIYKENLMKEDVFVKESYLLAFWLFINTDKDILNMSDLSNDSYFYQDIFAFLRGNLESIGISFPQIKLYSNCYEKVRDMYEDFKLNLEQGELVLEKGKLKKIHEAFAKVLKNDFDLEEVDLLIEHSPELFSNIYIQPSFSAKEKIDLHEYIDSYIEKFLNNELFVYDANYYKFEKQKENFIQSIVTMKALEDYGNKFIISTTNINQSDIDNGFLFIHTLLALKFLDYINILRIWESWTGDLKPGYVYDGHIELLDEFLDEINSNFQEKNPGVFFEKYEEETNLLFFAGKQLEISKKKRETDAVLLIKTLVKEERYWFEEEIFDDWKFHNKEDRKKNKIYHAARKINDLVKKETGMSDFIDHSTNKFRVNPKYLKS